MSRTCTVCRHKKRLEIEVAAASGETLRALAAAHGLSRDAIRRHMAEHGGDTIQEEKIVQEKREMDLEVRLQSLADEAGTIRRKAMSHGKGGDVRLALAALRDEAAIYRYLLDRRPKPGEAFLQLAKEYLRYGGLSQGQKTSIDAAISEQLAVMVRSE